MPAPSSQFFQEAGTARNFTLPSMNGSKKSLSDYSGQFVMLHFWATWCMSCIPEMRELQKLETELSHKGLKIVAVSIDSTPGPVAQFIKRQRLSFDILLDQSGSILERYNSASLPVTFLISPDGALLRFEDPDTGEITYKIEGSREWSDKPHNSLLQAFLSRS
jgi:peroxiredoxin